MTISDVNQKFYIFLFSSYLNFSLLIKVLKLVTSFPLKKNEEKKRDYAFTIKLCYIIIKKGGTYWW